MDTTRGFKVRALGEIAIRCADIEAMAAFYRDVIGLEPLTGGHGDGIVFFRIAEGFGGHTSVLALFRHDAGRPEIHPQATAPPQTGAKSSLHHIALSLPFAEQQAAMDWYDRIGQTYTIQNFGWIGWRGIFTTDPEGNTVELVAYDASLKDSD
ncbi:MAG: VOC family protein [Rhodobacter sp.]|nr:VOC family protein [Rhodobacter sp.]